jgi:dTDP-4-dehydrorhamnose reductase
MEKYFLIRSCGLYGEADCWGKGANFVDAMVFLEKRGKPFRVVNDQVVTPTSSAELAHSVGELIRTQHYGLYHLTNEGHCSWFEFASTIFSLIGKRPKLEPIDSDGPKLEPIDSDGYGARARRPSYSVLENKKAKEIGLTEFSPWVKALKDYLIKKSYLS